MRQPTKADGSHIRRIRTKANKKRHIRHEKPNLAKHGLKHGK